MERFLSSLNFKLNLVSHLLDCNISYILLILIFSRTSKFILETTDLHRSRLFPITISNKDI